MKPITQENRIYLAIWRKAAREDKEIVLQLPDNRIGLSTRMAMYRALRPFRDGSQFDPELALAGERFVLVYDPPAHGRNAQLRVTPRRTLSTAEAMAADLGLDEDDLMTPEELEQRMKLMSVQADAEAAANNPFYSRED